MSLDAKDKKSNIDINMVRTRLRYNRGMHSDSQRERNKVGAELDRLRSARNSLERAIADFASYRKRAGSSLDKIPLGQFRGDRRNRSARKVEEFSREIDKEAEAHKENRSIVDQKIRELEEKSGELDVSIRNLSGIIRELERQLK